MENIVVSERLYLLMWATVNGTEKEAREVYQKMYGNENGHVINKKEEKLDGKNKSTFI